LVILLNLKKIAKNGKNSPTFSNHKIKIKNRGGWGFASRQWMT
jgi:hypothetical protein